MTLGWGIPHYSGEGQGTRRGVYWGGYPLDSGLRRNPGVGERLT